MRDGVAIKYGDVAPMAKESFEPSVSEQTSFSKIGDFKFYNLDFPNYANPCEIYSVPLDGNSVPLPTNTSDKNIGLWSEQLSGTDGRFATPIVINLQAEGQFSSQGITLTFDKYNNIFATDINIVWQLDGVEVANVDFAPDSAEYFCQKYVSNYNGVVITIKAINMPENRLKLRVIDYGYGTFFYGEELRSVQIIQQIDPISTAISINTCDFTLDSKRNIDYRFQRRQPLEVYFNGKLLATSFVESSRRQSKNIWEVESEDYIGLLDRIMYPGGIFKDVRAFEILQELFEEFAGIPYEIDEAFVDSKITGYIPYTTCREALHQIAIAIGAVVDTSYSELVRVYKLSDEVTQTIPLKRIMQGQSFDDSDTVTAVEVVAHSYTPVNDSTKKVTAYNAADSGAGDGIFVKFSQPLHDVKISSGGGTIKEKYANYAIINATSSTVLTGPPYEHVETVKTKRNPLVLSNETDNVLTVDGATLIGSYNVDEVLDRCYEYLIKTKKTNLDIVEARHISGDDYYRFCDNIKFGDGIKFGDKTPKVIEYDSTVNVGDVIRAQTGYLGDVEGRIIEETYNLQGGIIVKKAVMI